MSYTINKHMNLASFPLVKSILDAQDANINFKDWAESLSAADHEFLSTLYYLEPRDIKKGSNDGSYYSMLAVALEYWRSGKKSATFERVLDNLTHLYGYVNYITNLNHVWNLLGGKENHPKKPIMWGFCPFYSDEFRQNELGIYCDEAFYNPELTEDETDLVRSLDPRANCEQCATKLQSDDHQSDHDYWERTALKEYTILKKWHFKKYGCH